MAFSLNTLKGISDDLLCAPTFVCVSLKTHADYIFIFRDLLKNKMISLFCLEAGIRAIVFLR